MKFDDLNLGNFDFSLNLSASRAQIAEVSITTGIMGLLFTVSAQLSELIALQSGQETGKIAEKYLKMAAELETGLQTAVLAKFGQ